MNKIVKFTLSNYFNFENFFINLKKKNYFFLRILKCVWSNFNKNYLKNVLILEVLCNSKKKDIKFVIELIFNIKVIKINTLLKKINFINKKFIKKKIIKKKAYIKFINFNIINY